MREPRNYRILVMDDEPALLKLVNLYLTRLGYRVDACQFGAEAWRTYQASPSNYDLVIADLNMPDVEVLDLLPRFPDLNSSIRVMVCSGEIFDVAALPRPLRPHFSVLQKPFVPAMLADAVSKALNAPLPAGAAAAVPAN